MFRLFSLTILKKLARITFPMRLMIVRTFLTSNMDLRLDILFKRELLELLNGPKQLLLDGVELLNIHLTSLRLDLLEIL